MVTDPVCFAIVGDESVRFISTYKNQKYYFCMNHCKKQFDENLQKYSRTASDLTIEPGGASC